MLPKCRQAVDEAAKLAGRAIPTEKQYQAIEDQISAAMRRLSREREDWQTLTRDQQMREAGKAVMDDIKEAADRKLANAQRQIVKVAETNQRIEALQESYKGKPGHDGTRAEAQKRDIVLGHLQITAERKFAMGGLVKLIEAAADKTGAGAGRRALMSIFDAENPGMTKDIVKEIFKNADGSTGNGTAKIAARAWLDTIEQLRVRFNNAGGDIGRLLYGYVPQPHDTAKIRKAGVDLWVEKVLPLLDRSRYVAEDGSRLQDAEVKDLLRGAYETLKTEGLNKQEPGAFHGTGARANKGSDSRQIHFADGEAWSAYMKDFGRGSIYDAMMSHVGGMVRDIGLIERYGPDANANARLQFDLTAKADGTTVRKLVNSGSVNPQTYWDMLTGKVGAPVDETIARNFEMVRNLQTAAKLGGAVVSSVTDLGTLAITTGYNKLPYWQLLKDIGSQATKGTRDWMASQGMIAESAASSINRWAGDTLGTNWSGKLAASTLRWSFLNAWTDGLRQGFTMSMNAGLARMAKMEWSALSEFDRSRLVRNGIDEADWAVLQTVVPTNFKGRELLTPQAIKLASAGVEANTTLPGAPLTPSRFKAERLQEIEAARLKHEQSRAELPAVEAAIDARTNLTATEKAELKTAERKRTGAASAEFTRLTNALDRRLMQHEADYPAQAALFAENRTNAIAAKVFGFIHDESEFAVVNPDMATRATITQGGKEAGTYSGEIARTVMQFKSFPIAMVTRHWGRMLELGWKGEEGAPKLANRTAYGFALAATLTGLGAIATQEKQILAGKDPIDMDKGRFWLKAVAQGGGLSIFGDLFLVDPASGIGDATATAVKNVAGPAMGSAFELAFKVIGENIWQAAEGKDSHWGAELFSWAKAQTPAANLWWLKPMVEHGFTNAINEGLSPGYLSRVQQRAQKDWGQRYWWRPQDSTPQRPPGG